MAALGQDPGVTSEIGIRSLSLAHLVHERFGDLALHCDHFRASWILLACRRLMGQSTDSSLSGRALPGQAGAL
jgi:hypothetical protein